MIYTTQLCSLRKGAVWHEDATYDLTPHGTINKPSRAMWTSTYTPDAEYKSEWLEWCAGQDFGEWPKHLLIEPAAGARIYHIDSPMHVAMLPHTRPYSYADMVLDFPRIALNYDALHLTSRGASDMHFESLPDYESFNSWDVESTVWFRRSAFVIVGELES